MWEIDTAFQLIPSSRMSGEERRREEGGGRSSRSLNTREQQQIIEGKRAERLILLSDGPGAEAGPCARPHQGELEVRERERGLCGVSSSNHQRQHHEILIM